MAVSADQVATLQAYLAGDLDRHKQLYAQLDQEAIRTEYTALVAAAFFKAAYRRFAKDGTRTDVVEFVGDMRSRSERLGAEIDPRTAERLIQSVYTDGSVSDVDDAEMGKLQIVILAALIADEELSESGLADVLADARELADKWVS